MASGPFCRLADDLMYCEPIPSVGGEPAGVDRRRDDVYKLAESRCRQFRGFGFSSVRLAKLNIQICMNIPLLSELFERNLPIHQIRQAVAGG